MAEASKVSYLKMNHKVIKHNLQSSKGLKSYKMIVTLGLVILII